MAVLRFLVTYIILCNEQTKGEYMAASDRNKNGKPVDYVVHYSDDFHIALCGKKPMIISLGKKGEPEISCKLCLKILNGELTNEKR